MKLESVLNRIIELIVQTCDPETIVLFGSFSKGQENLSSDLDILVIGHFHDSRFLRDRELRQLFHRSPIPIDLHIVTPQEVAGNSVEPLSFLGSALDGGVVLYSKKSGPGADQKMVRFSTGILNQNAPNGTIRVFGET
jgi:predicted nucleotidyltransferase